ncbi:unnamed protein product [Alopecurus aequalis]
MAPIDVATVPLPYHLIFDILSRLPVKSVCRFRCVSMGWRDLISNPVFAAAHTSRHGPLLVDTGSFEVEEPDEGRDVRLMDMDGNIVRVIKGVGGYGMLCNTSLDDLICVNGASCGGVNVVDPATGETLMKCPHMEVIKQDAFPGAAHRYYIIFGFGRAIPSGEYKLLRLVANQTWEIFTMGDGRGWRQTMQPSPGNIVHKRGSTQPSPRKIFYKPGSPVVIDGVMYVFEENYEDESLLCFDLESERWKADVIRGPRKALGDQTDRGAKAARLTELNGALCIVHSVFGEIYRPVDGQPDPFTNIWILDSKRNIWIKAYTITMAPNACRYMPLRVMDDGGKLLLQCSIDKGPGEGWSLVLQIYDPRTDTCIDVPGTPDDLDNRIGLCSFGLDHPAHAKSLLARFLDQALLFFSN